MHNGRNFFDYWWFLLIFCVFFGFGGVVPLIVIAIIVVALMVQAVKSSNKNDSSRSESGFHSRQDGPAVHRYGFQDQKHSADEKARVNVYLMKRYNGGEKQVTVSIPGHQIVLALRDDKFRTIDSLDVICDGSSYGRVQDFRRKHSDLYDALFDALLTMAQDDVRVRPSTVIDAEFVPKNDAASAERSQPAQETAEDVQQQEPVSEAEKFRDEINSLNDAIPDEEISNGLYETTSLLKQLGELEVQFPESRDKLSKLYRTYLPYMITILKQYIKMQNVQTDPNYSRNEQALKQTIQHINSAMKDRLIPSMSENDSINLSADMNTLESMLRKDGMTDDNDIASLLKKNQQEAQQEKK